MVSLEKVFLFGIYGHVKLVNYKVQQADSKNESLDSTHFDKWEEVGLHIDHTFANRWKWIPQWFE